MKCFYTFVQSARKSSISIMTKDLASDSVVGDVTMHSWGLHLIQQVRRGTRKGIRDTIRGNICLLKQNVNYQNLIIKNPILLGRKLRIGKEVRFLDAAIFPSIYPRILVVINKDIFKNIEWLWKRLSEDIYIKKNKFIISIL